MPKRRPEEDLTNPPGHTDSGIETKSRSGRVVKPKVYNDGTVALMDDKIPLDEAMQINDVNDDLPSRRGPYVYFDEDGDLSDASEGSYGSTRTRTGRGASSSRLDSNRPSRRAATRPPRASNGGVTSGYGGGGVFKQAAIEILRTERRLMSTGEIARLALRRGLVRCTGKTPEATMASALYTDIKRREDQSVFVRPREGLFGLREWVEEGTIQIPTTTANTTPRHSHFAGGQPQTVFGSEQTALPPPVTTAAVAVYEAVAPGTSQDSQGDRLMELLCAAEEIDNRAAAVVNGGETTTSSEQEGPTIEQAATVVEEEAAEEENEQVDIDFERNDSTTAAVGLLKEESTDAVAIDALRAAEAAVHRLEREKGANHPEVGKGYLTLAKLYMADCSAVPPQLRQSMETALGRAQAVLTACHDDMKKSEQILDATVAPKKLHKIRAPPAVNGNSFFSPTAAAAPMAAPTPVAVEEMRAAAGPFASAQLKKAAVAAPMPSEDVENDTDVDIVGTVAAATKALAAEQQAAPQHHRLPLLPAAPLPATV